MEILAEEDLRSSIQQRWGEGAASDEQQAGTMIFPDGLNIVKPGSGRMENGRSPRFDFCTLEFWINSGINSGRTETTPNEPRQRRK
jgi:hypothetical protein